MSSDSDNSGCLENRRPPSGFQVTEIRINRLQMETCKHQERSNVTVSAEDESLLSVLAFIKLDYGSENFLENEVMF